MPGAPIDIAIIGAGIAGCAAALTLADGARSVIVVAPPAVPAARIGEFLSPAANKLLAGLGLTADFAAGPHRQANATFSAWGSDLLAARNAIIHVEGPGHVLDRSAFEAMLRAAVARRGVTTLGSAVTGADRADGAWSLRLSGGERIRARFLLDCSGRAAVVTRHLARRHHADRLVAAYGFLRQHDDSAVPTPATLIEAAPNGWWYASLLPDQRLALALFADPDTLPRGIAREMLVWRNSIATTTHIQRWAEDAGFAIEALPRLASAATTWLAPVAGTDWASRRRCRGGIRSVVLARAYDGALGRPPRRASRRGRAVGRSRATGPLRRDVGGRRAGLPAPASRDLRARAPLAGTAVLAAPHQRSSC